MTPFKGQTENAGHFLQPTAKAIGHNVMSLLPFCLCALRVDTSFGIDFTPRKPELIRLILVLANDLRRVRTILWRR